MSKRLLSKLIPIGKVVKVHGIKGELKFFLYNKKSNLLLIKKIKIWFEIENEFESFSLKSSKGLNGEIVKLNNIFNNKNVLVTGHTVASKAVGLVYG